MIIAIPPCPQEKEGERHPWIMAAANKCAHQAIKEAVDFITSNLTRAPSPHNEVETTVLKAFRQAGGCTERAGCTPSQPAHHTAPGEADRAAKERASKPAEWPEFMPPGEQQRKTIAELIVVAPEVVDALGGRGILFCGGSSEGPAIIICDRERKTAASLRLDGEPWKSSGHPEKFLPGSERGWPVGLDKGEGPVFLAAGAAGFVRMFHLLGCADMEREIAAAALLDASRQIAPAARPLFAGRKVCAFVDLDSRAAGVLLAAGAHVSTFDFSPYRRDDGQPVRDLADLSRIHPDDWETAHAAFTEAAAPPQPFVP